jgi:hypothetical protein
MNPTEQAAIKAIEAVQLDRSITLLRRREWQQVIRLVAEIVGKPMRRPGKAATVDKAKIVKLLEQPTELALKDRYQQIADEVGCSASYVQKVRQGKR